MELSSRFSDAMVYANMLHAGQCRKVTKTPYVGHLLNVAGIVLEHGGTEDEAIAALLHDAIEDQGGAITREEIRRRFGNSVVSMVDGCSETDQTPKPPWRQRKEAHIRSLMTASKSVRLISAADKLDNVRSILQSYFVIGNSIWDHFHGRRDGTLWFYRATANALKETKGMPIFEDLEIAIGSLENLPQ